MEIAGREFGPGTPLIVAEVGPNHCGDFDLAMKLVKAAADAGADAVKLQMYHPSEMTVNSGKVPYVLTNGPWRGRTLWSLYGEARTPYSWLPRLYDYARSMDLIPFCSVFHPRSIPFLEELGSDVYKIASPEAEWGELVKAVCATGKQVIISDGVGQMVMEPEWHEKEPIYLRCVSKYPAKAEDYSFANMPNHWGLSDHSVDVMLWVVAATLGATVIEAHLMLDVKGQPVKRPLDFGHSWMPFEFELAAESTRKAALIAYASVTTSIDVEFRRRYVWVKDLPKGHEITEDDYRVLRCSKGRPASWPPPKGKILFPGVTKHTPVDVLSDE